MIRKVILPSLSWTAFGVLVLVGGVAIVAGSAVGFVGGSLFYAARIGARNAKLMVDAVEARL